MKGSGPIDVDFNGPVTAARGPQHSGDFGTTFYPSCVIDLTIRLDTSFRYKTPQPLSVADLVDPPLGDVLVGLSLFSYGDDDFSKVNGIIPRECHVEKSGYRKGGKYSFTLDFRDFPIDARLIKAGSAAIYAGTVSARDFAAGIEEQPPRDPSKQRYWRRRSILKTTADNLMITGPLDKPKLQMGPEGAQMRFEGRDRVSILADIPIDPKMLSKVDPRAPINEVVQKILSYHPASKAAHPITVICHPDDWPGRVVPSPGTKDNITRVRRRADGNGAQMHGGADPTSSIHFWDLIVNYTSLVGGVPYFTADGLLCIRPAVGLHDWQWAEHSWDPKVSKRDGSVVARGASQVQTPFAGNLARTVKDGEKATEMFYRRMVYGRNIEELTFERKCTGIKARTVQVNGIDDDAKGRGAKQKLIRGEFPPKSIKKDKGDRAKVSAVTPEGDVASTDVVRVLVHGIRSQEQANEMAKALFNEMMHQEISGHCQTKDMTSFGGDNGDPDLLRLEAGDPVQILVDTAALNASAPHVSELLDHSRRDFLAEVDAIRPLVGGDENFARAVVATARDSVQGLQNTFRTSDVKFDFNMAGDTPSVAVSFDFQNYVEVQFEDVNGPPPGKPKRRHVELKP